MGYRVQLTQSATEDARQYAAYILETEKTATIADEWLRGLFDRICALTEMPQQFSVIEEAAVLKFPYRSFLYHSHRVVFAIYEQEKRVVVHRVWHSARDSIRPADLG